MNVIVLGRMIDGAWERAQESWRLAGAWLAPNRRGGGVSCSKPVRSNYSSLFTLLCW